jgi:predicted TIM-barrel fold metal-dependent hydrolase
MAAGRLWVDSHIHIRGCSEEGGPRDFGIDAVLEVMERDEARLVWITSPSLPEIERVSAAPREWLHWANEGQLCLVQEAPPGRLFGSVMVHPAWLVTEHGFVQVGEVLGHQMGFQMDCPEMVEIARRAAELKVPLQLHCSTDAIPTGVHIRETINLARAVPEAKVIAAHAIGGRNSYQHIVAAELHATFGGRNLWLEIRDFHHREYLRAAVARLGSHRLIAGTDWIARGAPPFASYGSLFGAPEAEPAPYPCCVASLVGFLREAGCSEDDVDRVAAGNAVGLFGLRGALGEAGSEGQGE